ncbi:hypothetical protein F7725_028191 [Dissostichus mawsoni]|uniref:Cystatin domain-containing protein n=1 Tax=Dissostichus mawsoni TaxID=36200 RepID=A0A7J5XFP6_DISMA|nr:hypothetical protein F7725_028191 [Dissostichus mawsoni]
MLESDCAPVERLKAHHEGITTLLLLCSTALLCSAAPAVEPVTCSEDGGAAAARMAAHHIDENHDHGYNEMMMMMICPDCPKLISLHDPDGMKSVKEAVQRFNENTTNQNYFILKEVGRIKIGWMMMTGSNYWAEIALVESHCPMGSRILPEACKPLCPDRARHAYCRSYYSKSKGLRSVECEYYPPMECTNIYKRKVLLHCSSISRNLPSSPDRSALAAAVCFMYLSIMKGLRTLLLLCSTALLCSAAPAVEPVTCSEDGGAAAARMAAHHIDENHDHGYKFKLSEIKGNKVEKAVMANCSVRIHVTNGDAKVRNYHCDTRQVKTDSEMVSICPDCPNLISLHDPDGMKSVKEAVQRVNENTTNQNYFILKDVGRIKIGWMMTGMNYWAEIALVESNCPMGSRILPEACKPLCPDRALCHVICYVA